MGNDEADRLALEGTRMETPLPKIEQDAPAHTILSGPKLTAFSQKYPYRGIPAKTRPPPQDRPG